MTTVKVNGVNLYVEVRGQGPPILGIHGTPSSALLWAGAASELGKVGRCIIYDRRGFFRSERPEPFETVDLDDHVEDAAALLDALSASPAVVVGRSTGGQIALGLAHRFPDKVTALALLEPALFSIDAEASASARELRQRVLEAEARNPGSAAKVLLCEALGDEAWKSLPDELREMLANCSPAVLAEMRGRGLDLSANPLDLGQKELASMRQPTLLVSAEESPDLLRRVTDRLADLLPRAEKVLVPGGHLIYPAHPVVLDFVARHSKR